MIRINLLGAARNRAPISSLPWWVAVTVVGGPAIAVAAVVLVTWWFWSVRWEAAATSGELAAAEADLRRMAPAVGGVRDAEAGQADLGWRVALIEELHARRGASVRMLDRLSRVLPEGLWLSEVREESAGVLVRGYAPTLAGVSEYAAALEAADPLGAPVEIVDSQRRNPVGSRETVSFGVRMPFSRAVRER